MDMECKGQKIMSFFLLHLNKITKIKKDSKTNYCGFILGLNDDK